MAEQIGRVLGGRYRLRAPIGRGASAQVFLADDVRLRRSVAVKVLHDALAEDQDFLRRFRAEAQAAAALNHPHVMAAYDWGQDDDGVPWIVTEYLGGGSLRAVLDRGHRLTPSQALVVGLQAARGLDYAHRRGFVHRDIKPANLLFDDDGRLRIADFGLARALAEAAWTEPQGAVVGTARYASPEQAQGLALSGRADVYSLALVVVEAVTGQVPFASDTTLGTLMARVGRPLVAPDGLGPLGGPVEAAGTPDPDDRLDARGLAVALARVAPALPRPAPLPLAGAVEVDLAPDRDPTTLVGDRLPPDDLEVPAFVAGPSPAGGGPPLAAGSDAGPGPRPAGDEGEVDLTALEATWRPVAGPGAGTVWPSSPDVAPSDPPASEPVGEDHTVVDPAWARAPSGAGEPTIRSGGADGYAAADDGGDDGEPWDPRSPTGRRRRRWPWTVLAVLLLAGAGVAAGLLVADLTASAPTHRLPTVAGSTEAAARSALTQLGYRVAVDHERRDGTAAGEVLGTRPAPGTEVEEGEAVTLVVSAGPTLVDRPDLARGLPRAEAEARLVRAGLVPAVTPRFDEEVPAGQVVEVEGGLPERLERGTEVGLVVSQGPEPRAVPDGLVGAARDDAVAALEALGLAPVAEEAFSDDVAAGLVISLDPGPGTQVERGGEVVVVVSQGPDLVTVPDVSGAGSLPDAVALLEAEGLAPGEARGPAAGTPAGTSPAAGERVRRGAEVDILLD